MASKKLDFEELKEAMNVLAEYPEKVTEILLGLPREKYETIKKQLFCEAFPDENSVIQFINDLWIKEHIKDIPNFAYRIIDFLITEQYKMALFNSEFWKDGDISLREVKNRILEIIKDNISQGELFPVFRPQKSVELKKEFALNFGGLERIETNYKHLLNDKLSSGLTLQQHIDKVRNWFNSLHGENLGNWIKLFAYVKAAKDYSETEGEAVNFREVGSGRYCFSIKQNKDFFSFFIRRDKNTGQFTTKAKTKFLKWLHDNQNAIEFPMILNGKVWNIPMRIYEYAENVSDKEILFKVDTNILESEFKDYMSINIEEIDAISEAWDTIANSNPIFIKHRLKGFSDIPLKLLLSLKNIYSREGDYKNADFAGNTQRLLGENLDAHLGNLSDRVKNHLKKSGKIITGKTGKLPGESVSLILETAFTIAVKRGWLLTMPKYEDGKYKFNINAGYFDRKNTARRLVA
jgi:hypothetical protein